MGKDSKKDIKKDSGSSSRSKDKGKSPGGHPSKGKEKERNVHYHSSKGRAEESVVVSSSTGKGKGKEKSSIYGSSAPASASPFGSAGTQFEDADLINEEEEGDDGLTLTQPTLTYSSSAPRQTVAISQYYKPQESYVYSSPNTGPGNYFDNSAINSLAETMNSTQLADPVISNPYGPQSTYVTGGYFAGNTISSGGATPYVQNPTGAYAAGNSSAAYAQQAPRGSAAGRGSGRPYANTKGTYYDIQGESNREYKPLLAQKDFKRHHSNDYRLGRVVKLFWFEPRGGNGQQDNDAATVTTDGGVTARDLQDAGLPGKVRRFVIIESRNGHSTGIPILTYGFRGCAKPGCHPEDHSMIFTGNRCPNYLPGEPAIPNPPVKVRANRGEKLHRESRVNYAKKYTIEHNFNVAFVGDIAPESSDAFWETVNRVVFQANPNAYTAGYPTGNGGNGGAMPLQQ